MISSKGLVVVGDERSGGSGLVGGFVMPDGGGEGEESLADACGDALGFAAAVAFEVELGFEGLVDGFDDLAEWSEESLQGPGFLSFDGGSDQGDTGVDEFGFEPGGAVALVGDKDLSWPVEGGVDRDHVGADLAFVVVRCGERVCAVSYTHLTL